MPIPVAAPSKMCVCGPSPAGIAGSNPSGGTDVFVSVVYCHVEVSASSQSFLQRSPTECGVSECDGEVSSTRRPWPPGGCWATTKQKINTSALKTTQYCCFKLVKIRNFQHRYLPIILLPLDGALVQKIRNM
jgi:hypothetical protein